MDTLAKDQLDRDRKSRRCAEAIAAAGGPARLAALLTESSDQPISSQAISQWSQVPAERCLDVEKASGISRYELRPDVYGEAPAALVSEPAA